MNDLALILPLGYSEAAMFLRTQEASRVRAIISIHGKQEHGVESDIRLRLDLEFDDVAAPDPTDPIAAYHARMRQQARAADGLPTNPPTIEHARAVLDFAASLRPIDGILLCHCAGGISRSPAAALLCLASWKGPGHEQECMQELLRVRPSAMPHEDLIRFGDALLHRDGKLIKAARPSARS